MEVTIIALSGVLLLLLCALVYSSKAYTAVKMFTYPILLGTFFAVGTYVYDNLGAPLERPLPLDFKYQHHLVEGETILVWLSTEDKGHRLHRIDYARETAEALEQANDIQERGGNPHVNGKEKTDKQGSRVYWKAEHHIPQETASEAK